MRASSIHCQSVGVINFNALYFNVVSLTKKVIHYQQAIFVQGSYISLQHSSRSLGKYIATLSSSKQRKQYYL